MQFSIIIPAKNEEANIGRCLDSLVRVDWDRNQYEVIVVDNGSSDRTVAIARDKAAHVYIKPGLTISALRNYGVSIAKGEILAFLDADCTVAHDWLREASRYICHDEVVCFGSPPAVPEDASWVQSSWFLVRQKDKQGGEIRWLESMNMFVRREVFIAVGGFNEELVTCEDYDLSLRLKLHGKLVADERILAVHHGEAATLGHFFRKEYWRGTSNLRGMFHHGINLKELPSVLFPLVYCIVAVVAIAVLIAGLFKVDGLIMITGTALFLVLQVPLFLLAVWKNRPAFQLISSLQLYLLLNIYFLARGGALFQWR